MELTPKKVSVSEVIMTQLVLPTHTNSLDTIFGGTIMSWIDIAAAISAQRHCNRPVVTASMDQMSFYAPVRKGWVVNLKASVNFVAKTSMEIGVKVTAENPTTGELFHTSTAYMTFVALNSQGRPTDVPPLILESADDKRRFAEGKKRRELRLLHRAQNPK